MRKVRYRLEIDYLSKDYNDWILRTSAPVYTKDEGFREYRRIVGSDERCIDNQEVPVRVHLWRYNWDQEGNNKPITIARNY